MATGGGRTLPGSEERRTEAKPEMVHPKPVQASPTPTSDSTALCFDADATGAYCAASLGMGKASLSTKGHSRPNLVRRSSWSLRFQLGLARHGRRVCEEGDGGTHR